MKKITVISALVAFIAVSLGAFGAHALKAQLLASGTLDIWQTAVNYNLIHALAAYFITFRRNETDRWVKRAGLAWIVGVFLFSGSLYALALGGPRWLGPITPLGGLSFLIGWGCAAWAAWQSPSPTASS